MKSDCCGAECIPHPQEYVCAKCGLLANERLTQGWNICKLLLHPCQQLEEQKPTVSKADITDMANQLNRDSTEYWRHITLAAWLKEIGVEEK